MCGPHFCSMELTQQLREFAAEQGVSTDDAIERGLVEKADEFRALESDGALVQIGALPESVAPTSTPVRR